MPDAAFRFWIRAVFAVVTRPAKAVERDIVVDLPRFVFFRFPERKVFNRFQKRPAAVKFLAVEYRTDGMPGERAHHFIRAYRAYSR